MIQGPRRQSSGKIRITPLHTAHERLETLNYPSIVAACGTRYFVDQNGLITGLSTFGDTRGQRRVDCPYQKPDIVDVLAAMEWIEHRGLIRQKTGTACSYSAKHWAERFLGRYIPNGAAIIAFDRCGFTQHVSSDWRSQLNTMIAVSRNSYKSLPECSCNSNDWPNNRVAGLFAGDGLNER